MAKQFQLAEQYVLEDIEKSVIASLLRNPELYKDVADVLSENLFFNGMRDLFRRFLMHVQQGSDLPAKQVDAVISEDLRADALRLKEAYRKRLLADALQHVGRRMKDGEEAGRLVEALEKRLRDIRAANRERTSVGQVFSGGLLDEILSDIARRRQAVQEGESGCVGLSTGLSLLDRHVGGLQPGIFMLTGEPGAGKTSLALQLATKVSAQGVPAIYVGFEEPPKRLALKAMCLLVGLETKRYSDGFGDPADLARFRPEFERDLAGLHFIEGSSGRTVEDVRDTAWRLMDQAGTRGVFIVVDYIQKWAFNRRNFKDFRHAVSSLSTELLELSRDLEAPVLVLSNQNRSERGKATMTSMKESGDLEYDADVVGILVEGAGRKACPPARCVDLVLDKNRFGEGGVRIPLLFRPTTGRFSEEERKR